MQDNSPNCPICAHEMIAGYTSWHFICNHCNYESSTLQPEINSCSIQNEIDENAREEGLLELRKNNFRELLESIKAIKAEGTLLDVGCAHGWFLELAQKDFNVLGLEPDEFIFEATLRRGLPVRKGFFPIDLKRNEKFDVIVFNDVIEHIQDIEGVLKSCFERLNENGLLVVNLPSSSGLFYRLSKLAIQLGMINSFDRMWQKGMPSPHLHYFNQANLSRILAKNGFDVISKGFLKTLMLKGLFTRISYAGKSSCVRNSIILVLIILLLPILSLLPKDIFFIAAIRK